MGKYLLEKIVFVILFFVFVIVTTTHFNKENGHITGNSISASTELESGFYTDSISIIYEKRVLVSRLVKKYPRASLSEKKNIRVTVMEAVDSTSIYYFNLPSRVFIEHCEHVIKNEKND